MVQLESADGYILNSKEDQRAIRNPGTTVEPKSTHTVISNLWYNNGRWVASKSSLIVTSQFIC